MKNGGNIAAICRLSLPKISARSPERLYRNAPRGPRLAGSATWSFVGVRSIGGTSAPSASGAPAANPAPRGPRAPSPCPSPEQRRGAQNQPLWQRALDFQCAVPITVPPLSRAFNPSITTRGSLLRLARVHFCARPCSSRWLSRNNTAGGESRFGTVSMNIPESNHIFQSIWESLTWTQITNPFAHNRATRLGFQFLPSANFGPARAHARRVQPMLRRRRTAQVRAQGSALLVVRMKGR